MEAQPHAVEVETVAPSRARATRDWFGMVVSIAALVTSVVSIALAVQNSDSMNRLVQANSWPYLQITTGNVGADGSREIAATLTNVGIGPLRIESFVVAYEGEEAANALDFLRACCLAKDVVIDSGESFAAAVGEIVTSTPTGVVLGPGDKVNVFRLPLEGANQEVWRQLDGARFKARYRACYCSVFDECWSTDFENARRSPVKSCKPEANSWDG